jgi:hypothetical protein
MLTARAGQRAFEIEGLLVEPVGPRRGYLDQDQVRARRQCRILFLRQPDEVDARAAAAADDFSESGANGVGRGTGRYADQHSRALQLCGQKPKLLGQGAERLAVEARSGGRLGRRDKSRRADEQGDTPEERQASVY